MSDAPDADLLEKFARDQSEAAFAELVRRYIGLVYSAASRKTDNSQHAEDITQAVFIVLARKAKSLGPKTVLAGWLYQTAQWTAANFRRAEQRRVRREQEAFMQSAINEPAPEPLWRDLSPVLEDAMSGLGAGDRDAIVLRFFQNRTLAEVGAALGIAERAAQKRVLRALEKLRKFLAKHGVHSSTDAIAGAISAHSVQAAPAVLAKAVTAAALAHGATTSVSTLTLVKGVLSIMAWTKAKTALIVGIGLLVTAGAAPHVWYYHAAPNAWRHRFEAAYRLRNGEVLRNIPPPFMRERLTYYQNDMNTNQVMAIPTGPLAMTLQQDKQGRLSISSCVFGPPGDNSGRASLREVLYDRLGFKSYEIEGPDRLLNLPVNGDWTIGQDVAPDELLKALEPILWKCTKRHIHFEKQTVERDVIVVRGDRSAVRPGKPIQLYAEDLHDDHPYDNGGDWESFLKEVGSRLGMRLVDETTMNPQPAGPQYLTLTHHLDFDTALTSSHRKELAAEVMKNLGSQTGLVFTDEQRPVSVWLVTRQ